MSWADAKFVDRKVSIAVTVEVPREHINNALASATASRTHGAGYWADFKEGRNGALLAREREDAANGGRVGAWYGLEAGLDKGLATMARIAPEAFGRLLAGDIDAPLGDMLVQCIVCGELRYG
jgi:hypothetical protein